MIPLSSGPPPRYLSSREAAARLGVKETTLYAYVARGLLRSQPGEEGRARRYSARDVDALLERRKAQKSPEAAARRALFWGSPVVESSISFIDGVRLYYRGVDATTLAARATFEQAATLLWTGALPDEPRFPAVSPPPQRLGATVRGLTADAPPITVLQVLAPALGVLDPARFDTSPEQVVATARRLVTRLTCGFALAREAKKPADGIAATLLVALGVRPVEASIAVMDRALVLCAEHELNPSTFAARVAASTGADPYAVVAAALATITGPKHGGASERVEALLREVETPARVRKVLLARAARGEPIPGFGHILYPSGDPRVAPLLSAARELAGKKKDGALETLFAVVDAMADQGRPPPNLDLALVAVSSALRLPAGSAGAIFALGRTAGWIAHALEQYGMDELIRPRARYVGPAPASGEGA
jgi:citrate synthase